MKGKFGCIRLTIFLTFPVKAEKLRRESQVAQGGTQLTEQQINERIARQNIIQKDVKNGTYREVTRC